MQVRVAFLLSWGFTCVSSFTAGHLLPVLGILCPRTNLLRSLCVCVHACAVCVFVCPCVCMCVCMCVRAVCVCVCVCVCASACARTRACTCLCAFLLPILELVQVDCILQTSVLLVFWSLASCFPRLSTTNSVSLRQEVRQREDLAQLWTAPELSCSRLETIGISEGLCRPLASSTATLS